MDFLFIIILTLFISPLIIFLFTNGKSRKLFNELINFDENKLQYSNQNNKDLNLIFVPHPFTNWSLNPAYKNNKKEPQHTQEGFKKTDNHNSIIEKNENETKFKNIICIGGSTTQCMEMENYQDTWPAILNSKLREKNFSVYNFGVGAWGTTQSLIRCQAWLPIIKPDLMIIYQTKNDFTPFYQGDQSKKFIHPDYQNIYGQFSNNIKLDNKVFLKFLPLYKLLYYFFTFKKKIQTNGLLSIYRPYNDPNYLGLKRVNDKSIENIVLRLKLIFEIANYYNSKVIYIPEIIYGGEYNKIIEENLLPKVKKIISNYNNVSFVEIQKNKIEYNKDNFLDKMHFSLKGNKKFSNIIYDLVLKNL
tara:strand:- start:1229 stop:2308 length:1080 start_codon:yes stop_codon:yes gene_type:complete